jgi:hypothetical protein
VFDRLLDSTNDGAWVKSRPPGATGAALMKLADRTFDLLARSISYHIDRDELHRQSQVSITAFRNNIGKNH